MKVALLAGLCLAATAAHAQFKCTGSDGKVTFQQAPCTGGTKLNISSVQANNQPFPGSKICEIYARKTSHFKDPDSLKIAYVGYTGAKSFTIGETTIAARTYGMLINGKNSYGAYSGQELYTCYLSEDEQRVLKLVKGT